MTDPAKKATFDDGIRAMIQKNVFDATNRSMKGLIGLQLHSGPPMKVEFRNIWLKTL